jgi:hypothetical protein
MSFVTTIFTDKSGKPMGLHGGADGMSLGIEDIPRGANAEQALSHVFSSFAANEYSISDIDFGKVTFRYDVNGKRVEQSFTKDELKAKQREFMCSF